jgi:hypothetical protein
MPYLVSSIIAIVAATIILLTRYEADDSAITAELDRLKSMFVTVDRFVNTYIDIGGNLTNIDFEELFDGGILLGNMQKSVPPATDKDVDGVGIASTMTFPSSNVIWHLIPNIADSSSYKLLIDIRQNTTLMSKARFSESFSGREYCEKMLFGTSELNRTSFNSTTKDFEGASTDKDDGLFVCIVYK